MLDRARLDRLLDLHDKTYRLFLWVNTSLRGGGRTFAAVGGALSFSEAASDWLRRNREDLPEDVRPVPDELEEFSHLFVSYLSTSFEIVDNRVVGVCGGCFCCGALKLPRHLRARNPDAKARRDAEELKRICLRRLAEDLQLPLIEADLKEFVAAHEDLRIDLATVTYAQELERRSRFASQGEGVLALWREFAWTPGGRPRAKFRLKAEDLLAAEKRLAERLKAWTERA